MKIFILEEETWHGVLLRHHIALDPAHEVRLAADPRELLAGLHLRPDVIITGYRLGPSTAADVLREIREQLPATPVLVICQPTDRHAAIALLREGAYDCLVRGEELEERLAGLLRRIMQLHRLQSETESLKKEVKQRYHHADGLIGNSPPMQEVLVAIEKAAEGHAAVILQGEPGTGRELVAKTIHYRSPRQDRPFVSISPASMPGSVLERTLFGYEKGAFEGAAGRCMGKLEEADGGTLYFDEIAEMDLALQIRLLRVLQERELTRIGGTEPVPVNIRVIAATRRDLAIEVQAHAFHEELYQRLLGLTIELPPLRDRGNDVLLLARHFLQVFCRANGDAPKHLTTAAREKLLSYSYPGNVRELRSVVELAAVLADGNEIGSNHIQTQPARGLEELFSGERKLREYERRIIQHYLDQYNYDVLFVADKLGIGKSTIYRMIQVGELQGRRLAHVN